MIPYEFEDVAKHIKSTKEQKEIGCPRPLVSSYFISFNQPKLILMDC